MKAYIIHSKHSPERDDLVKDIVTRTHAEVMEAIFLEDRVRGCAWSHYMVAQNAKQFHPDESYIVFEDDCVLTKFYEDFVATFPSVDVTYIGYNDKHHGSDLIYGTHAVIMSPKARDVVLQHSLELVDEKIPYDHILFHLIERFGLTRHYPPHGLRNAFAYQQPGLLSTITGNPR